MYCSQCGQRKFDRSEQTLAHFVKDAFHVLTHFDFKIFNAVFYLFTRPGFLTKEYSAGKINSYIKPFTLFLLLNAFFFFIGHGFFNIKDADYSYYLQQYPASHKILVAYNQVHGLSEEALARRFNAIKEVYQKAIYFIIIPLYGFGLQLVFAGRGKLFIENLVQAIHTFCWYVLTLMIVVPITFLIQRLLHLSQEHFEILLISILFCLVFVYNYLSVKRIYSVKFWPTIFFAVVLTFLLMYLDSLFAGWLIFQLTLMHFRL